MDYTTEAPVAPSARSSSAPKRDRTKETKRLGSMYAGVHAYVGLYYDRQLNSTKAVGLSRLYGRVATLGEVAGVALAELGALGPERFDFACVLRVGEEDVETGGVSVRLDQRQLYAKVRKGQVMAGGPQWASAAAQREAEQKTLALLHKHRHYVAVLYNEERDAYMAEPLYDLIDLDVKGTDLGYRSMWALGQYDVSSTLLVAALEIGNFEDGFNARFCHVQLVDFA